MGKTRTPDPKGELLRKLEAALHELNEDREWRAQPLVIDALALAAQLENPPAAREWRAGETVREWGWLGNLYRAFYDAAGRFRVEQVFVHGEPGPTELYGDQTTAALLGVSLKVESPELAHLIAERDLLDARIAELGGGA